MVAPTGTAEATVLVLHSWWGLTEAIVEITERVVDLGYVAVAPDLYHGALPTTAEECARERARPRRVPMWRQIVQCADEAKDTFGTTRTGQIGLSMGGHWAMFLARQAQPEIPRIDATVVLYAARGGDLSLASSAFQLHFAERDEFVTASARRQMLSKARGTGHPVEVYDYPGTGHWFFEPGRPEYHAAAAELAWQRIAPFLAAHL